MSELTVELYGVHIGTLRGDDFRTFDFMPSSNGIDEFGLSSTILSESVPLDLRPTRARAKRRRNFFSELLPEGDALERLSTQIRAQPWDAPALLRQYGRDVAGALQIYDPTTPAEPLTPRIEPVSDHAIASMLRTPHQTPLGNVPVSGRTSLAGVQQKIVLAQVSGSWNRALDGYPSTHIIKPVVPSYPTMIFDEEYGARLARAIGLNDHDTRIEQFDGTPGLVIERYDRDQNAPQGRIHQEDMCQALGIPRGQKYQELGGLVSLKRIAELVRRYEHDSLRRLLELTILSVGIGNLDMHAKNLSAIHRIDGTSALAPAYDVVPLTHYPNIDGKLAMSVNGQYIHRAVTFDDLVAEAESWGLRMARERTISALERLREHAAQETPLPDAYPRLQDDVLRFTGNLLSGRAAKV